ncbi:nudC domain-containing protein 1 [Drosophila teissieri]|uniref:nudC domain-containing protein 1 n=1 Tax=Drosophila teissieri TaxID=7243 RepID=UPI001CB9E2C3|nr:nudC domain-containing protein 1 [Drosophila teissieri]
MPVVELKVDRNLVCPNFDGYKLSFDSVPVLRQDLGCDAYVLEPHASQFSLLHVELFARHNHLVADPWLRHHSYFFNERHQLVQCTSDPQSGHTRGQRVVFTVDYSDQGDERLHRPGDYNYTIIFVSERFCVICDGMTSYHLVDTGDRSRSGAQEWQRITRSPVNNASGHRGFELFDARLDVVQERKQISLVAGHVARRDAVARDQTHVYYMDLTWARWTQLPNNDDWSYSICQRLETTGSLQYCAFEPRAESLVIASNREVQTPEQRQAADEAAAAAAVAARLNPPVDQEVQLQNGGQANYGWSQTADNVLIRFKVPSTASAEEFDVSGSNTNIVVKHRDQIIFTEELYASVGEDLGVLKLAENGLELNLTKAETQNWPRLLAQEDEGVAEEVAPMEATPLPIPDLENPLEECDLGPADEEIKMVRFNLSSGNITHTIFLGSTPLVLTTTLRPGFPAAFATRQGVDASIWLQMYQPSRPDEWSVRHEGQLHAFGYVQASKVQRKFTACCPDLDYVVICDPVRHVLVYFPSHESAGGLRRRNGPPVSLGKQNLVTLGDNVDEILGITTANNVITVLSKHALLRLQV